MSLENLLREVSTVTTAEQYRRYATAKNIQPALEDVGYGAQAAWFGSPAAQRVIVYIPGGGFVYYAAPGDMNLAHEMYLAASADDGDVAVAVMAYETARKMPYPNILRQIGALVAHLMKGRDPANIDLAGNSAGSAALLGFLLHLHHPHPKVDRFTLLDDDAKSLGRILLISPWGPVCTASMVVDGAAYEGRLGVEALKGLWQLFASTHPETEIVNPWTTPQFVMYEDWYAQLPAGEITTLIGGKELARHEMIRIANVIKVYHKAPSHLVIDEASDHGAFVGEHLFHLPPSDMTKSVYRWAKGGD